MRKLLIGLAICLIIAGCKQSARAEINLPDLLKKLPALNQSVIFSLDEYKFDYAVSTTLVKLWQERISIDLGYSPRVEALGLVSIKLVEVKNLITFPILDKIVFEPFIYFGMKRLENLKEPGQSTKGVGVKIISLKF